MIITLQQPRILYYAWQLEVCLHQLEKYYDLEKVHILTAYDEDVNDATNSEENIHLFKCLEERFKKAKFFYYQDNRESKSYIPTIVANLLKNHFLENPWLEHETIFATDSDQIFTKEFDFSSLLNDDICYMSDSRGFINYDYINYKRPLELYEGMCEVVGIDPQIPKLNNDNSGGSHYLLKKVTAEYFAKVETDANNLFKYFQRTEPIRTANIEGYYGIQQWGALMWSLLWNLWVFNKETKITEVLKFTWASDLKQGFFERPIYHNAGIHNAIKVSHNLFMKADYTKHLPYDDVEKLTYNEDYAVNEYVKIIREVGKASRIR